MAHPGAHINLFDQPVDLSILIAGGDRTIWANIVAPVIGAKALLAFKVTTSQLLMNLVLVDDVEVGVLDAEAVTQGGDDRLDLGPLGVGLRQGRLQGGLQGLAPSDEKYEI